MNDSTTTCDGIVKSFDEDAEARSYDEAKTIPTHFNKKKKKKRNLKDLLAFTVI